MDLLCALSGIVDIKHPRQGILDIAKAQFQNILLDMAICNVPEEVSYNRFHSIQEQCEKEQLEIKTVFVPDWYKNTKLYNNLIQEKDRNSVHFNRLLEQFTEECISICGRMGCGMIVIPSFFSEIQGEKWEMIHDYYRRLGIIAKENKVKILLINQSDNKNGHLIRGICSDAEETANWLDRLNQEAGEERFAFCMDTGICNLCGQDMHEFILTLGKRIQTVILRDCDGHRENSMLPFSCVNQGQSQTDWLGLIRGLREIGFDGQLVLKMEDTVSAFSPLLRPPLLTLAKSVAEYFRWQIEIETVLKKYSSIVLFGAGNMCRNYIKCYGEKYPPLFTCDNNKEIWGTSFCGLEVKPPEALKELPSNCGVLICNIYYREIEKQLQEMGISQIAFFNDEYMPSYYFDTLRYWKGERS